MELNISTVLICDAYQNTVKTQAHINVDLCFFKPPCAVELMGALGYQYPFLPLVAALSQKGEVQSECFPNIMSSFNIDLIDWKIFCRYFAVSAYFPQSIFLW